MHIRELFQHWKTTFSFEFFPPKSDTAAGSLFESIRELEPLKPAFVSVTYGAGGSTREATHDLVVRLKGETPLDPTPHLTCVCHTEREIGGILERYARAGISNILALRGDVPRGLEGYDPSKDELRRASDLVAAIRRFNDRREHPHPEGFGIGVAGFPEGHPECPNRLREIDLLKAKVDAGADFIITQLFFDNHTFLDYRDRCRHVGIDVPIIAGIMPVTSLGGMKRMAELALGTTFPAKMLRALDRTSGDEEAVRRVGVHWATQQCAELLDAGVDGIHFYTLNNSSATREIYASLGVNTSAQLAG